MPIIDLPEASSACRKSQIINFQDKWLQRIFPVYQESRVFSVVERLLLAKVRINRGLCQSRNWEIDSASHADGLNIFFFTVQNNQMYNIASHLYSIRAFFALYFMQLDNKTEYCLPFENEWNINKSTLHYLCCPLGQISYVFASSLSLLSFSGYSCLLGRHQNV